ncbi:MAG: divalent metal cation transporter [Cyclobacteriaceae bacterium]
MKKSSNWKNVLFWAVLSAAFIGPGTVATAASAGAGFGLSLMWALFFSVFGCIVLQEAASRITIVSGLSLGKAIGVLSHNSVWLRYLVGFAVIFGCAAYQAGNILGAVAGISLFLDIPRWVVTLTVGGFAALLLATNSIGKVSYYLGFVVALMGLAFLIVAFHAPVLDMESADTWKSMIYPSIPSGSDLLILGLIGTTIVPYNLFLGSGISHGQTVGRMRQGLIPAIVFGGLFSAAVIVCGTLISGSFTFEKLFGSLTTSFGPEAGWLFATGLFAAGFTSSVTAPMASGLTLQMTLPDSVSKTKAYNIGWIFAWTAGISLGLLELRPVPVILMAQALNGLVLPVVTFCIGLAVNHKGLMSSTYKNGVVLNIFLSVIIVVSSFLGFRNIYRAAATAFDISFGQLTMPVLVATAVAVLILFLVRLRQYEKWYG